MKVWIVLNNFESVNPGPHFTMWVFASEDAAKATALNIVGDLELRADWSVDPDLSNEEALEKWPEITDLQEEILILERMVLR